MLGHRCPCSGEAPVDECRLDGASAAEVSLPSQWSCSAWLAGPGLCPPHSESCSYRKALSVFCGVANPAPRVCRVHFLPPAMGQACIGPQGVFGSWQLLQVPAVVVEAWGGCASSILGCSKRCLEMGLVGRCGEAPLSAPQPHFEVPIPR